MATTAVSSAKVAVVDSGKVGRSAVYSRYKIKWDYKKKLLYHHSKYYIPTDDSH
jgi:hypothetical protein